VLACLALGTHSRLLSGRSQWGKYIKENILLDFPAVPPFVPAVWVPFTLAGGSHLAWKVNIRLLFFPIQLLY
jgi:hypothetical protein